MTSVAVTLQETQEWMQLLQILLYGKLQEYIIDYRTSKAKEDCSLLGETFQRTSAGIFMPKRNMLII